jgi:hypothetical protein
MKINKVRVLRSELNALVELINRFPGISEFYILESKNNNLEIVFDLEIDYSIVGEFKTELVVEKNNLES